MKERKNDLNMNTGIMLGGTACGGIRRPGSPQMLK